MSGIRIVDDKSRPTVFGKVIKRLNRALTGKQASYFGTTGWHSNLIGLELKFIDIDNNYVRTPVSVPGFIFVFLGSFEYDYPDQVTIRSLVSDEQEITEISVNERGDPIKTTKHNSALVTYDLTFRTDGDYIRTDDKLNGITFLIRKTTISTTGISVTNYVSDYDISQIWNIWRFSKLENFGEVYRSVRLPKKWSRCKLPVVSIETNADMKGMLELLESNGGLRFWNNA